jgi:hypothetical protein
MAVTPGQLMCSGGGGMIFQFDVPVSLFLALKLARDLLLITHRLSITTSALTIANAPMFIFLEGAM